ncbi:1978_t:CDS:2 [Ambispora gerdemannii]|uniref:1978_t:CDS:1 n=1 Tax=Ambispora gerdemannii TaxID=144530 RepID=A0A9N8V1R3_9GLOM|nr:1978_t:CDS:2 [Ambispora gerdemannii]
MTSLSELKQRLLLPHYIVNLLFCLPFFAVRYIPFLSSRFLDFSLEPPELKLYGLVLSLIVLKYRSSTGAEEFLSILFLYGKIVNILLLYMYGRSGFSIVYGIMWGALFSILPQPNYQGPSEIVELSGDDLYEIERNQFETSKIVELSSSSSEQINDEKGNNSSSSNKKNEIHDQYWIVLFFAMWSPACRYFEGTLAKTSLKYTTENIHFGKIDLERFSVLAQEYNISLSPTSLDLPTLILFKNGTEIKRLPQKLGGNDDDETKKKEYEKLKSETLKSAKATWDRLGWDRSMQSIVSAFKLDVLIKD